MSHITLLQHCMYRLSTTQEALAQTVQVLMLQDISQIVPAQSSMHKQHFVTTHENEHLYMRTASHKGLKYAYAPALAYCQAYLNIISMGLNEGLDNLCLVGCQLGGRGWPLAPPLPQHLLEVCMKYASHTHTMIGVQSMVGLCITYLF